MEKDSDKIFITSMSTNVFLHIACLLGIVIPAIFAIIFRGAAIWAFVLFGSIFGSAEICVLFVPTYIYLNKECMRKMSITHVKYKKRYWRELRDAEILYIKSGSKDIYDRDYSNKAYPADSICLTFADHVVFDREHLSTDPDVVTILYDRKKLQILQKYIDEPIPDNRPDIRIKKSEEKEAKLAAKQAKKEAKHNKH